jgi:hypothetical protein
LLSGCICFDRIVQPSAALGQRLFAASTRTDAAALELSTNIRRVITHRQ